MKAVITMGYGAPFTVAEVPVPRPGPGQIQVRIAAAALNPVDLKIAAGDLRPLAELSFPHVPGNDFAGTVTEAGPGVTAYQVGDEIFGHAMPRALRPVAGQTHPSLGTGTLAEFAVVEADTPFITRRPRSVSAAEAAALGTAGLAARALALTAAVQPGETVLVIGASGGVGTALLPLLPAAARVIATAHPADADLLSKLGADDTIGYDEATYPTGVDVALNLALPSDQLAGVARALRPGGRLYTITFPVPRQEWLGRDDVSLQLVLDTEGELGGMREVAELAAEGALVATVGRTYSLEEGPQAYADLAQRHTVGKLVILP
ncbi:NADP-dependent oxidoreductase [Actinoplanes aureus]|uniref:NADP-dependent oxidoreductase n=1 Tax=Actinoplanes aureus TaxID=2792083 RepID=A0A931CJY5_9ACTN|nr:NADP-dependent oxidoreductase [Actinoplanes aureus]MBG0567573.1 NADP-dependent oxidoreductase [Actinoplanes aureus]